MMSQSCLLSFIIPLSVSTRGEYSHCSCPSNMIPQKGSLRNGIQEFHHFFYMNIKQNLGMIYVMKFQYHTSWQPFYYWENIFWPIGIKIQKITALLKVHYYRLFVGLLSLLLLLNLKWVHWPVGDYFIARKTYFALVFKNYKRYKCNNSIITACNIFTRRYLSQQCCHFMTVVHNIYTSKFV